MDKKTVVKAVVGVVLVAIPFGLTVIGAYYGVKKYREYKDKKKKDE